MSVLIHILSLYSVGDVDVSVEPNLEEYIKTADFDDECHRKALIFANSSSDEGGSSGGEDDFWSSDGSVSSATTADISKSIRKLYVIVMHEQWLIMPTMTNDSRVAKLTPYGDIPSKG